MGKVIQMSAAFPFTDIHGWTISKQNPKKMSMINQMKMTPTPAGSNDDCFLWHFNPKWDSWFRGVCKGIHRTTDVEADQIMPSILEE